MIGDVVSSFYYFPKEITDENLLAPHKFRIHFFNDKVLAFELYWNKSLKVGVDFIFNILILKYAWIAALLKQIFVTIYPKVLKQNLQRFFTLEE